MWKSLTHKHLVELRGIFHVEDPSYYNMVMDWQTGRSSLDFLRYKASGEGGPMHINREQRNRERIQWEASHRALVYKWVRAVLHLIIAGEQAHQCF